MGSRQPLGKVVTQVEMNNAEARNQLREMLEFQILEKEKVKQEEQQLRQNIINKNYLKEDEQLRREVEIRKEIDQRD
jgi:hypothetical protein